MLEVIKSSVLKSKNISPFLVPSEHHTYMTRRAMNSERRKKDSVYVFIRELIQKGEHAQFVNEEGRFLIKWDKAVELYIEYRATKNPKFKRNADRRKASNALREALLYHYKNDGAKEFEESRRLGGKTKVIERQFQMPSGVFSSLFRLSVELSENHEPASGDQSDTSGISGSDSELMQVDQSWLQWLHENLCYDFDMTPKQSPMQGGDPFCVTFRPSLDEDVTTVHAVFVKSDIVLGSVEMVISPDCLYGRKIPGASSSGWGKVIFKAHHGVHLGSTKLYYYTDDKKVVVIVKTPSPSETLCKDMSCHTADSSTCSDEEPRGFESCARRLVFDACKNSQPLPENYTHFWSASKMVDPQEPDFTADNGL